MPFTGIVAEQVPPVPLNAKNSSIPEELFLTSGKVYLFPGNAYSTTIIQFIFRRVEILFIKGVVCQENGLLFVLSNSLKRSSFPSSGLEILTIKGTIQLTLKIKDQSGPA